MLKFTPILFIFLLFACQRNQEESCCAENFEIPITLQTEYASNFDLVKTNTGYKLHILSPENGEIEKIIQITPSKNHKIISLTSTLNGMISILGEQSQLVGISNIDYIFDKKISSRYQNGEIQSFGDENAISLEKIIQSEADIIFYSGFGEKFPHQEKLEKLGITIIPVYDWRENHPLGKAEWIKLVGAITNSEEETLNYFDSSVLNYEKLIEDVQKAIHKPSVLAGSMIGDIWYAPGGESYFAKLLSDANAIYRYADTEGTASLQFSIEQILKDNEKTEFWINPALPTYSQILESHPKLRFIPALKNQTYCYSAQQSKFWEQSAAMPHLVLQDLIQIFHSEIQVEGELYFYKKVE